MRLRGTTMASMNGSGRCIHPSAWKGYSPKFALRGSRKSVSLAHLGKKVPGVLCKRRGISASPGSSSEHYRTPKLRVDDAHVPIRLRSSPSCRTWGVGSPANFACRQNTALGGCAGAHKPSRVAPTRASRGPEPCPAEGGHPGGVGSQWCTRLPRDREREVASMKRIGHPGRDGVLV